MFWLFSRLRSDFKTWDRPTRIAVVLGVLLLIALLIAAAVGPEDLRVPALIGAGGLVIVSQIAVLWGNRGMISPFTQAQRHYLAGSFDQACDVLEAARTRGKIDVKSLTLLGNTYRQLGRLAESQAVLAEAVARAPEHYFARYGFGRTLLSRGEYAAAVDAIVEALRLGAPSIVQLDLAEAYYRLGQFADAVAPLESVRTQESHRALMQAYLLYRMERGAPPSRDLVAAGLPYWMASAARFNATPYGGALAQDVERMQALIEEMKP